jgi:hypothetical protein
MTICQMREKHLLAVGTDVVAHMTIDANFPCRHIADGKLLVGIAKEHNRVDEVGCILVRGEEFGSVVYNLAALAVA